MESVVSLYGLFHAIIKSSRSETVLNSLSSNYWVSISLMYHEFDGHISIGLCKLTAGRFLVRLQDAHDPWIPASEMTKSETAGFSKVWGCLCDPTCSIYLSAKSNLTALLHEISTSSLRGKYF